MHKCTIAIVTVHICTVTVACAFNILIIFSLSLSLLSLSLSPDSLLVSALTSSHSHFSSFAVTLTSLPFPHASTTAGQTMPPLLPIIKPSLSPLSLFLNFITFLPILFVGVGILRFWSDLVGEHGIIFVGVDFGESRRRLQSTFIAAAEEDHA